VTDDPEGNFMKRIIEKSQQTETPSTSGHVFCKAQDKFGERLYLSADTEEEIETYCEGGALGEELAIEEWCRNVTPIMVIKHFKWVGKRRNPCVVARPVYVNEEVTNSLGQTTFRLKEMRVFKEKF
jgi:hypothetical protein